MMLTLLVIVGMLMEVAAIIMAWPLCFGWHPELVTPFLVCFVGGFLIFLLLMCTGTFWRGFFGVESKYPWED